MESITKTKDEYLNIHYDAVIMTMLASQITSLTVVYSIVYSGVNQRKHQSSASLAFVRAIHRGPVNFPHKWPVTRKMFPFDDVIMLNELLEFPSMPDTGEPDVILADGEPWWRHQMETFSALLALCAGIHRSRWIPRTKASDAELWCFLWSSPE